MNCIARKVTKMAIAKLTINGQNAGDFYNIEVENMTGIKSLWLIRDDQDRPVYNIHYDLCEITELEPLLDRYENKVQNLLIEVKTS